MKKLILITLCFLALSGSDFSSEFSKYPATLYQGKHKIPKDYQCSNGECRDINNKIVDLSINFAGKYSIIAHSCGTGCRFYSMLNVESGDDDFMILSKFNTTPDMNNKDSIDDLLSKKDSNLLIAKYQYSNNTCKQEKFIFKNNVLESLTKKLESCE